MLQSIKPIISLKSAGLCNYAYARELAKKYSALLDCNVQLHTNHDVDYFNQHMVFNDTINFESIGYLTPIDILELTYTKTIYSEDDLKTMFDKCYDLAVELRGNILLSVPALYDFRGKVVINKYSQFDLFKKSWGYD